MRSKNIIWGVVLLTLGLLFLLKNFGFFYFNWWSIFRLWPVILVLVGITLLPLRNAVKVLLSVATIMVTALILVSFPNYLGNNIHWRLDRWDKWDKEYYSERQFDRKQQNFHEPFDPSVEKATLNIDAVVGEFYIDGTTKHLLEFEKDGNIGPYIFSSKHKNGNRNLSLSLKEEHFRIRHLVNDVGIRLNKYPVWSFDIETGAAKIDLVLNDFKVEKINIEGGASAVYLKIGEKYKRTDIDIYQIEGTKIAAEMGNKKIFNMVILGGFLKIKPIVQLENVIEGLKKSLSERYHHLIPLNKEAIAMGMNNVISLNVTENIS